MKKLIFLLFLVLPFTIVAQSIERHVVASAGYSYFNGSNLYLDYTIGEVAVMTLGNSSNFLTQGFQQPSYNPVFINENPENPFSISIYPNPTPDRINVVAEKITAGNISVQLYDIIGQMMVAVYNNPVAGGMSEITLNLSTFASGTYFLRVFADKELVNTFKIIKISQ